MSGLSPHRIVCAANRHPHTKEIVIGPRHFDSVMISFIDARCNAGNCNAFDNTEYPIGWRQSEEGFIDQHGKFYTREEAWEIAKSNGQLKQHGSVIQGVLHSEDLY